MNWFRVSSVFRFLVGILLTQAATVVLVIIAMRGPVEQTWLVLLLFVVATGLFTAVWFASIANHARKEAVARTKEDFSRERERIRVRAEQEKTKLIKESHQQIIKETSRVQARANLKLRVAFVGLLTLGAFMLFTQFMTLGLITLTTAGGALGGYVLGARQDFLGRRRKKAQPLGSDASRMKVIGTKRAPAAIQGLLSKVHSS